MTKDGVTDDLGPFTIVPKWVVDSKPSPRALMLYVILGLDANRSTGDSYCSRKTLGKRMKCSPDTVDRARHELETLGALEVSQQHDARGDLASNRYHVIRARPRPRADAPTGSRADAPTGSRADAAVTRKRLNQREIEPEKDAPARTSALTLLPDPVAPAAPAPSDNLGFSEFWEIYPKRNGKRLGRRITEGLWCKLTLEDRRAAWRGAVNYAQAVQADITIAKDPERFIKHGAWEDWQEPAETSKRPSGRPSVVERSWTNIAGLTQGDHHP